MLQMREIVLPMSLMLSHRYEFSEEAEKKYFCLCYKIDQWHFDAGVQPK